MDRPGRPGRFRGHILHHAVAEPRGQRRRSEGGEVVVEVAALGSEDGGGDALRERPCFERGRGALACGVAVGGDEEAGDAGERRAMSTSSRRLSRSRGTMESPCTRRIRRSSECAPPSWRSRASGSYQRAFPLDFGSDGHVELGPRAG